MAGDIPVIIPKLGQSMENATIVGWLKAVGQKVRMGEPLLEIETDKANYTIEAPADGELVRITAAPGDIRPVTEVVGYISKAAVHPA
jgi:pyruvate/2-oxoglutarate dehydrogenase complex dihydrolipoamide acyltransferase (E2) component